MRYQEDSPKYWHRWLQDRDITRAVEGQITELYRALRGAHERMWTFAFAGAVAGAGIGVLTVGLLMRFLSGHGFGLGGLAFLLLAAALAAALAWWVCYWLTHRSRLRRRASLLTGRRLPDEQQYVDNIIESVAAGLATSQFRPSDTRLEMEQLTQATIVTGLREAPTSELERHLLERLVGSAFVPTSDGSVFVFKLGTTCMRCDTRTRTGPLRLLNVPGHWAVENGYQRLRELPSRGRHLRVVLNRAQELTEFLGKPAANTGKPMFFGPTSEVTLCDACAKEALKLGLLQQGGRA
jgi:hypothetical protein